LEIPLADPALELQPDGADGFADWCEEIQTGRLTAPRDPRDRDADHVPGAVDQGAAAVSRLERDVALDEALALLGAVAADDAARHRAAERKRRADRVHLGADGKIDGRYRQRAGAGLRHFENRDVALGLDADQLSRQLASRREL